MEFTQHKYIDREKGFEVTTWEYECLEDVSIELGDVYGGLGAEMLCPICGFNYMHQESIDVHFRAEDEKGVPGYRINHNGIKAPAFLPNPSSRRDGLVITFWCEGCLDDKNLRVCLAILQHKGQTCLQWYTLKKSVHYESIETIATNIDTPF